MTYGALRHLISKRNPGVDLELIDGWFQIRYEDNILSGTSWKRMESESVIQVPDSYATGTVAITRGATAVTGTGTTFTAAMTGLMIRIGNSSEYYQFTYVSATSGTLDRGFESTTVTAAEFRIDQAVFLLPTNCRIVRGVRPLHDRYVQITRHTPAELNALAPMRTVYGNPRYYVPTWDSQATTPQMQIELYPVPSSPDSMGATLSFVVDYIYDATLDLSTSSSPLPWVSDGAMIEGVSADICRWRSTLKTDNPLYLPNGVMVAQDYEAAFNRYLKNQGVVNAQQRGNASMKLAEEFVGRKGPYYRRGPRHEGFTG